MVPPTLRKAIAALVLLLSVTQSTAAWAQVTNFSRDVDTAIDRGFSWLDAHGAFTPGYSSAGDFAGLVALAMLEKRAHPSAGTGIQGYAHAFAADQARLDNVMGFIVQRSQQYGPQGFYAYRDGADLMALSVYLRTGGPNQAGALSAIHLLFDRIADNQGPNGYWCYNNGSCDLSETTRFTVAGLVAARAVFSAPTYADAPRLARLNQLLANARAGYAANGISGGAVDEEGYGYAAGYQPSIQDTAAGVWIQLAGGADLHDPDVQRYLRWLYRRYGYTTINTPASAGWGHRFFPDYLWFGTLAFSSLEDSGVQPAPGELGPADFGKLPLLADPQFDFREVNLDPATVSRPPLFVFGDGEGGAGYYSDPLETPRWSFDFAYTLLERQQQDGGFYLGSLFGFHVDQALAILTLQRALNAARPPVAEWTDTDGDGLGDADDADDDGDGVADMSDAFPLDADESVDTDGDHTGNNADTDDDGDGVVDTSDAFPLNAGESVDTDHDGTGNNADADDDNDGAADASDAFPLNAAELADRDGDGTGDNADPDDDNNGIPDSEEPPPAATTGQAVGEGGPVSQPAHAFGFLVKSDKKGITGALRYRTRADRFTSTRIINAGFANDGVVFRGVGQWNGLDNCTFEARAVDAGEPGKNRDRFAVTITAPNGAVVLSIDDVLSNGNVNVKNK